MSSRSRSTLTLGLACLLAAVAFAACGRPGPTVTPTVPQLPAGLTVVSHQPDTAEPLRVDEAITLTFDRPVDEASAEAAFSIVPAAEVAFSWTPEALTFAPSPRGWERATTYVVTLSDGARGTDGVPMTAPYSFEFRTVGYLEIAAVQPVADSADVSPDAELLVMFNRPVVPLDQIMASPAVPVQPIAKFAPPVLGASSWLNTSIYQFSPDSGWLPGTTYKAIIDAATLSALTDDLLQEPYTWEFTSAFPQVLGTTTSDGTEFIGPSPRISLTFSLSMSHATVEERLSVTPRDGERRLPGRFEWSGNTVAFVPAVPLALDSEFDLVLEAGATAQIGGEGMPAPFRWSFRTIELPRVVSTLPAKGDTGVDPYSSLLVSFSSPIQPDSLLENVTIHPAPEKVHAYWLNSDTQVQLSFGAKASTTYHVSVSSSVRGRFGHLLAEPFETEFSTAMLSPSVTLAPRRIGTYNAYTTTILYVQHINVPEIRLVLYELDLSSLVQLAGDEWWQAWDEFTPDRQSMRRQWVVRTDAPQNEYRFAEVALSPDDTALAPGAYFVEAQAAGLDRPERHVLLVSRYNVMLKASALEALVWVTDLATGKPAADRQVTILGPERELLAAGATDEDGVLRSALDWQDDPQPWDTLLALVEPEDDLGLASSAWDEGLGAWEFGYPSELYLQPSFAYVYTDREIYRPGQSVYYKGILRADDDGQYALPTGVQTTTVTVTDNEGRQLLREDRPLNTMGTWHGQLDLGPDASLGTYYLSATFGDRSFGASFRVAEYRKPEFVVEVRTDDEQYIQGDDIGVGVGASYYFGGPLAGAPLTWRLMSQDYFFALANPEQLPDDFRHLWYDFHDQEVDEWLSDAVYGGQVTSGRGSLDSTGAFQTELEADLSQFVNSQIWTIEASVTDPSNQEVSGRFDVVVHKGEFYLGLAPRQYVASAGEEMAVNVISVRPDSSMYPKAQVELVLNAVDWFSVQKQSEDGRFYWTWEQVQRPVMTQTVTTDSRGVAVARFVAPSGGSYRIRASSADGRGNPIRSSTYVWVSSGDFVAWRQENHDRIDLVPDKRSYEPGDVARILVPSPLEAPVWALLTLERGHIYEHRLLQLDSNSDQIEVPIELEYAPNLYVSIVIVKGTDADHPVPSYRVGYCALEVSARAKELVIQITPDRDTPYQPGERAMFDLLTTDATGAPTSAELSFQVVDLSVLALTGGGHGSMIDRFYRSRGLGVRTSATLAVSIDRYRQQAQPPAAKGGDGGAGGLYPVRTRFVDTAFWEADVVTDADGRAKVTVDLPDNLTTWRASARAVTRETLVGEGSADIVATKDLLVRPVVPRFFVLGDQSMLGAVVHNSTSAALNVSLLLTSPELQIQAPSQQAYVAAHSEVTVYWETEVVSRPEATLLWQAAAGSYGDSVQLVLPVHTYAAPELVATSGQVAAGETLVERLRLPERFDPTQGGLTVQLDPSLSSAMVEGLSYLEHFPYECVEQTVSRFLPNVATFRALRSLDLENAELETRLAQLVGVALQRIYALQHSDGGWGWWVYDESSPFISAYTLLGLSQAHEAGFLVDESVMERAARYLEGTLEIAASPGESQGSARAFVLYVLAQNGRGDLGRTIALYERRGPLSLHGRAFLLMALHVLNPPEGTYASSLATELVDAAIISATGVHWEEDRDEPSTMSTNVRTTALVLQALLHEVPDHPLLANAVRWLMSVRQSAHWSTTQETAWSIMALTDYMVTTGELKPAYTYEVSLNDTPWGEGSFGVQNVQETRKLQVELSTLLAQQVNTIALQRSETQAQRDASADASAGGRLYYSIALEYYLPASEVKARDRGIVVSHRYTLVDAPDGPIEGARVGDVIQVKVTVIAPNDLHFLVVEDPLPAGCEALDQSLETSSSAYGSTSYTSISRWWPYWSYFGHAELRDEKVVLFASYLPKGTHEYTYLMRASVSGSFYTMPTYAYEMYFPEVFGRSEGRLFVIR